MAFIELLLLPFPPLSLMKRSTEVKKQHVRERFEDMRCLLKQDEQAVLDSLELDLRQTRTRLDQVLNNWDQHLVQVNKSIATIQKQLTKNQEVEGDMKV